LETWTKKDNEEEDADDGRMDVILYATTNDDFFLT